MVSQSPSNLYRLFSIRLDSDRWYYWKYERDRTQFWPPPKSLRNFRRLREQKLVKLKCFFFLLCTVLRKLYDAYLFVRILTTCFYNDMAFTQKRVAMAPFKTHHCIASRGQTRFESILKANFSKVRHFYQTFYSFQENWKLSFGKLKSFRKSFLESLALSAWRANHLKTEHEEFFCSFCHMFLHRASVLHLS